MRTWVQRPNPNRMVQEDSACHGATKACTPQLLSSHTATTEAHKPRAHAPQQEKPPPGEAHAPQQRVQFSSVAQSCPTLRNPMNCSTPGLPVHYQLPESTQTHLHWVGDAIQPSLSLSSPSPPALNRSQHQGLFQWVGSLNQVAKVSNSLLSANLGDLALVFQNFTKSLV